MHLGYYIHAHGYGHTQRAIAITQHCQSQITIIGTDVDRIVFPKQWRCNLVNLPPDRIEFVPPLAINRHCHTRSFHYAPYGAASYQQRMIAIARWVETAQPNGVVVDVSAEITQYLRLLGIPAIGVRQHGNRTDSAHLCGYDAAYRLFAPYPAVLESDDTPQWIKDKTIYVPGFSRYEGRSLTKATARAQLNLLSQAQVVLVLKGKGGNVHHLEPIIDAANHTPEWLWVVVGPAYTYDCSLPQNLVLSGWQTDTFPFLKAADVVIASAGHNTVMEIGAARVPYLAIPEERPFDEQKVKAKVLESLGLCHVAESFPTNNIDRILSNLLTIDTARWENIVSDQGAKIAAFAIEAAIEAIK